MGIEEELEQVEKEILQAMDQMRRLSELLQDNKGIPPQKLDEDVRRENVVKDLET